MKKMQTQERHRFFKRLLIGTLISGLWLSACAAPDTPAPSPSPSPGATAPAPPTLTMPPSSTALFQAVTAAPQISTLTPSPTPLSAEDLFQKIYATPSVQATTEWRPPLYPIPWAPTRFDHFYFSQPIAPNGKFEVLEDYSYGGMFFADQVHTGIDIPADMGTPVLAAGPGTVVWTGYGLYSRSYGNKADPYGMAIAIKHDFGYQGAPLYTIYAHLRAIDVTPGQHVETNTQIGEVGNTGMTTGPHLHFEVRVGENSYFATRNPELWMAPPIGWGVLAARIMDTWGNRVRNQRVRVQQLDSDSYWWGYTYGKSEANGETVIRDAYYRENFVMGNLPAGRYLVTIPYVWKDFTVEVEIVPGRVTFFTFQGWKGIQLVQPYTPTPVFATPAP